MLEHIGHILQLFTCKKNVSVMSYVELESLFVRIKSTSFMFHCLSAFYLIISLYLKIVLKLMSF